MPNNQPEDEVVTITLKRRLLTTQLLLLLALACNSHTIFAVTANTQAAEEKSTQDRETTTELINQLDGLQSINVTQQVADSAITQRIKNILKASEWIEDLSVTATEGIVTLRGVTTQREHRQWSEAIASHTEGVVAVINKIDVQPTPVSNFSPIIDDTRALAHKLIESLPLIFLSIVVLVIVLLLARYIAALSYRIFANRIGSVMLGRLIARLCALPVLLVGAYLLLNMTGLGNLATTIIGGTGLLGLIIGFAFRDIAENFLASILISIQRPFRLGDTIKVLDFIGVVQTVTTRGTVLMSPDGNHVQIPNTIIYKEPIINYSANPNIRLDFSVGIGYDASISQAQEIAMKILREHPAVLNHPESMVLAQELAASTVIIRIYFWVDNKVHSPLKVKSAVIRIVKHSFIQQGITMPDDAREVIFPEGIHVITEPALNKQENELPSSNLSAAHLNTNTTPTPLDRPSDSVSSTPAEANLTSDTPVLEEQGKNSILGEEETNLLTKK